MDYADHYREELAHFRTDLPGEQIAERCRRLSLLLTAAVRSGEITPTDIDDARRRMPSEDAAPTAPI